MRRKRSAKWNVACEMPALRHSMPGKDFDVRDSEVAKWLCAQPDIMQLVFESVKGVNIIYDANTGTWQGVNHAERGEAQ